MSQAWEDSLFLPGGEDPNDVTADLGSQNLYLDDSADFQFTPSSEIALNKPGDGCAQSMRRRDDLFAEDGVVLSE